MDRSALKKKIHDTVATDILKAQIKEKVIG